MYLIKKVNIKMFIFFLLVFQFNICLANEIVQDRNGNYYLIKENGSYKKLPPPKPGHKYVIKNQKKKSDNRDKKNVFNRKLKKEKRETRSAKRIITGIR